MTIQTDQNIRKVEKILKRGEEDVQGWDTPVNRLNLNSQEQDTERRLRNGSGKEEQLTAQSTGSDWLKALDPEVWVSLRHTKCLNSRQGEQPYMSEIDSAGLLPCKTEGHPKLGAQKKLSAKAKNITKAKETYRVLVKNRA